MHSQQLSTLSLSKNKYSLQSQTRRSNKQDQYNCETIFTSYSSTCGGFQVYPYETVTDTAQAVQLAEFQRPAHLFSDKPSFFTGYMLHPPSDILGLRHQSKAMCIIIVRSDVPLLEARMFYL